MNEVCTNDLSIALLYSKFEHEKPRSDYLKGEAEHVWKKRQPLIAFMNLISNDFVTLNSLDSFFFLSFLKFYVGLYANHGMFYLGFGGMMKKLLIYYFVSHEQQLIQIKFMQPLL